MDIDPIVLLAYISVSINIITMIAACIAYAIFHVRKRRRKKAGNSAADRRSAPSTPVLLRRYPLPPLVAAVSGAEQATVALPQTNSQTLAEPR